MKSIVALSLCIFGCATETDYLFVAAPDGGQADVGGATDVVRSAEVDSARALDAEVDSARALDAESVDVQFGVRFDADLRIDVGDVVCIQGVIDRGYSSCAATDPLYVSCDACAGGTVRDKCRSVIDCLRQQGSTCDVKCLKGCLGESSLASPERECVSRIVTASCGWQPWMQVGYRHSCTFPLR